MVILKNRPYSIKDEFHYYTNESNYNHVTLYIGGFDLDNGIELLHSGL